MIRNICIWLLFPCILFSFIRLCFLPIRRHLTQSLKLLFSLRKPLLKAIDNISPIVLLIVISLFSIVIYTFFYCTRESLKNHKYSSLLLLIYTIVLVSLSVYAQMKKTSETKDKQQMSCVCTNFFLNDNDFSKNLSISYSILYSNTILCATNFNMSKRMMKGMMNQIWVNYFYKTSQLTQFYMTNKKFMTILNDHTM